MEQAPRTGLAARLALIVFAALLLRGAVATWPGRLIARDGVRYAKLARLIAEGQFARALRNDYPPGYAALVAATGRAAGASTDRGFGEAAVAVSVLAGALSVLPAFWLARRAAGDRAGLFAALALALHPHHVSISADALTEPLTGLLVLSALAAGFAAAERAVTGAPSAGRLAAFSAALGGAAFLVRPEGLLAPAPPLAMPGSRLRRAGAVAAVLALAAAPYVAYQSADEGRLTLSKKKDPGALLSSAAASPLDPLKNALRTSARSFEIGQAVAALEALGLAFALARGGRPARRLGATIALALAAYLAACSLVRSDPRFALMLTVIAAPLAGLALDRLARAVEARPGPRAAPLVAAVLALSTVPAIAVVARPDKPHYLACARAVARAAEAAGIAHPVVVALDLRIAYYAGAETSADEHGRAARSLADAAAADFIVLRTGDGPIPADIAVRSIGRFEPPAGERTRALEAHRVEGRRPPAHPAR